MIQHIGRLLVGLVLLSHLSCIKVSPEFGLPGDFLPEGRFLINGVVNKYYVHFDSKDGYTQSTNISYTGYQSVGARQLSLKVYKPDYELTQDLLFNLENDQIRMESFKTYYPSDTIEVEILKPVHTDWRKDTASLITSMTYQDGYYRLEQEQQIAVRDTQVMGRVGKVFQRSRLLIGTDKEGETSEYLSTSQVIYLQGIGLFSSETNTENGVYRREFIEQMPFSIFQARANHGVKRVAYIDPAKVMDRATDFSLCETESRIADYYNGDPDAGMIGGKQMLWERVNQQLDASQLGEESGYLTFRFVVNCRGKTGWFMTEQADLDFNPKTFSKATVDHLFAIIKGIQNWRACVIREETRDAYTYITFKLKHGKIIELLP